MTTDVLLGLGGNIGDPVAAMRTALQALDARPDVEVIAVSRLFRTPPWGKLDQPDFVNAAAALRTRLDPRGLLAACLGLERDLKRERAERWGPRTIDIDLLDFGRKAYRDEALTLPHPRMGERAFVLVPVADIAPDFVVDGESARRRLSNIGGEGIEPVSEDGSWWR